MPSPRPFRFGVIHEEPQSPTTWAGHLRRIEDLGFSTFLIRDHFVPDFFGDQPAPLVALANAAGPDHAPPARDHGARGRLSPSGDARQGGRDAGPPVRRPPRARARRRLAPPRIRHGRLHLRFGRHPDRSAGGDGPDPRRPVRRGSVLVHRQALHGRLAGRPSQAGPASASAHPHRRRPAPRADAGRAPGRHRRHPDDLRRHRHRGGRRVRAARRHGRPEARVGTGGRRRALSRHRAQPRSRPSCSTRTASAPRRTSSPSVAGAASPRPTCSPCRPSSSAR